MEIVTGTIKTLTVRREGMRVILLIEGRLAAELPWEAAEAVARALLIKAREAEEEAKVLDIAMDQAILLRAGAPIGLSSRPDIQKEAAKEAAWNSDLRRYMPGGVKSQEVFGTPQIIKHKPKGNNDD